MRHARAAAQQNFCAGRFSCWQRRHFILGFAMIVTLSLALFRERPPEAGVADALSNVRLWAASRSETDPGCFAVMHIYP